jgi:Flp pilus assembly protein TadD
MTDTDEQNASAPRTEIGPDQPERPPTSGAVSDRRDVFRAAVLVVLLGGIAYYGSFHGQFMLDDEKTVLDNESIRQLWPLGPVLSPPSDKGETVGGRPLVNLSLALNYAFRGTSVRGYHLVNLAIHLLAALTLLGIVRRTLLLPPLRGRFGSSALGLAMAVALLWTVHPMQTESVSYVSQRAESMMGLFYLLTLYCVIRASVSESILWPLSAVLACALGMASKEVMVTAPLMILLYDRTFLSRTFRRALEKRWALYACLAACWLVLAYGMSSAGSRGGTAFEGDAVLGRWTYAQSQFGVILHYLREAFWPDSLCVYWYGRPAAHGLGEILPGAMFVATLIAATIWGLRGRRKWGFLGAWFLGILAPTSSVVPILSVIFEHRMYLSLAAVAAAVVFGAFALWQRLLQKTTWLSGLPANRRWTAPWAALAVATVALTYLTIQRNLDYRSAVTMWEDLARKGALWQDFVDNPARNARRFYHLGLYLVANGKTDLAMGLFRQSVAMAPKDADVHVELGKALGQKGKLQEAVEELRQAVALDSNNVASLQNLGFAMCKQGNVEGGLEEYRRAIEIRPQDPQPRNALGIAMCANGKVQEGIEEFREIIRQSPQDPEAYYNLGLALGKQEKTDEAIEQFRMAIRVQPQYMPAYKCLAAILHKAGRNEEAMEVYKQALQAGASTEPPQ